MGCLRMLFRTIYWCSQRPKPQGPHFFDPRSWLLLPWSTLSRHEELGGTSSSSDECRSLLGWGARNQTIGHHRGRGGSWKGVVPGGRVDLHPPFGAIKRGYRRTIKFKNSSIHSQVPICVVFGHGTHARLGRGCMEGPGAFTPLLRSVRELIGNNRRAKHRWAPCWALAAFSPYGRDLSQYIVLHIQRHTTLVL